MGEFARERVCFLCHEGNKVEAPSKNIHFLEELEAEDVTVCMFINVRFLIPLLKIYLVVERKHTVEFKDFPKKLYIKGKDVENVSLIV